MYHISLSALYSCATRTLRYLPLAPQSPVCSTRLPTLGRRSVSEWSRGHGYTGHLSGYGGSVSLVLLHVTHGVGELNSLQGFSEWKHHIQLDWVLPLLPNASTDVDLCGSLSAPFPSHALPNCHYEHLFVLPGGVFKPYLTSGAFICEMTADLGCLDPHAIRSLKKVFKVLLQSSFWHRFSFGCPSYISTVRCLSFLPHAMDCEGGWRQIRVSVLCQALGLTIQDLNAFCESPLSICARFPTGHWIAERALEHRLSSHQGLPTRLRHLSCWNINSWQYPKPPPGDNKMRWVRRLLRKGQCCYKKQNGMEVKKKSWHSIYQG